jgi:phage-related protein
LGSVRNDIRAFPEDVQDDIFFALEEALDGGKSSNVKPLRGFKGASVLEIVEAFDGNAYRAVYTVRFKNAIYVLHAFMKKSRSGIATPQKEIDVIERRLRLAKADSERRSEET